MRHHHDHRQLSRTAEHRRALLRGLVTALFEYERIETTVAKAKEARRVAERMITYAKRNNLHSRRLVARVVQNEDVAKKLFDTIAPWYSARQGGYTRILKTRRRLGDAGEMGILELIKSDEQKDADRKARAARAEAAARAAEARKKGKPAPQEAEEPAEKPGPKPKWQPKPKAKAEPKAKPEEKPQEAAPEAEKPAAKEKEPKKGGRTLGGLFKKKDGPSAGGGTDKKKS